VRFKPGFLSVMQKYRLQWIFGSLFVLVLVLGFVQRQAVIDRLHGWKLLPQTQQLTELYFAKPYELPSKYEPDREHRVAFVVRNREHRTLTYQYVIRQVDAEGNRQADLASGTITIADGVAESTTATVKPEAMGRSAIIITITTTNQSIQYWVESN
jgi:hypothetical protein